MTVKAALLDAPASSGKGMYLRIDELDDEAALTDRHLPTIKACDLPAGSYVWIPDERKRPDGTPMNEYGGSFHDLAWIRVVVDTRAKAERIHRGKGLAAPEFRNDQITFLRKYCEERGLLRE